MLAYLAVGYVFEGIEILILGRDFNTTSPTTGAIEVQAAGIRNCCPVNPELVVVEPFVLRVRVTGPDTFRVLDQVVLYSADIELDFQCLGRRNAGTDPTFRIDLRILPARLIGR